MRLLAHISAFAILIVVGYLLATQGYAHFLRQTHSAGVAQVMTLTCLVFSTVAIIWATRKMP